MIKIRLKRTGRKGQPHYRIVIMESTKPRDSKAIAEIGYYNPRTKPSTIKIDTESAAEWLKKGAQPTETVMRMLVKEGLMTAPKPGSTLGKQKPKKKEAKA